ncbi:MAG TPA: aldehyde dehydrogenase family protein [Alphaproteobacteria bacterium]|nr:aldehyde dehydrogenase family protein [Alphaproteobacteria bacterium]
MQPVPLTVRNYIDGKWIDGTGARFESVNPATGEVLASAPVSGGAEVAAAVAAARRAFDAGDWRWRKGSERAAALLKLADLLESRIDGISELIAREMGKPVRVNRAREVEGAIDKLRYYAGAARMLDGRVTGATIPEIWDMELPEPVGVAALIIPWNDPVDLAVRKLGAALAAGCTTVVKSSEITPASTAALIEAVHDCGAFPAGVVNLLHGPGEPTGNALVGSPGVDKISFTGSTATGIAIMRRASERLAKVSLECGGKLPAVIFPDADLERCLDAVTFGAFMYAGQSCTACTRLVVHRSVHDRVVEGVVARSKRLTVGDPLDPAVLVGPMASRRQYDKALRYIALGLEEGGRAAVGGMPREPGRSLYLEPTVLTSLPAGSRVAREEVFGPVLAVHPFEEEREALALANDTPYGLGGSIWTQDISRALRMARRLDVADIWINTHYIRNVETSFGGRHLSGIGRELGMAGVEEYLSWKRVCIDTRSSFHLKDWADRAPGGAG